MTEKEYIYVSNLRALKTASEQLGEILLMDDESYPCVLDGNEYPEKPNLDGNSLAAIRSTISIWYESLMHHMDDLEIED